VPLYTRQGRTLALTPAGIELLAFARESQERDERFVARLHRQEGHDSVTLASGEGAYLYLLGDPLRAFARRKRTSLRLLTRDRDGTVAAVLSGEAHLGVAAMDDEPDGIQLQRFASIGQMALLPSAHPLAKKRSLSLRDLAGETLVVPPTGRPHRTTLAAALATAGVSWTVGAEATGWELIAHFARLGLGLAVVNDFCRVPSGLVSRPIHGLPPIHYCLVTRRGARHAEAVSILQRLIAESSS
jgi:DNA-binding transcriptional LysR family regulator